MTRPVTEFDLRAEEFKHPDYKPEDYEFRRDGKIVRKDRWEQGIRSIAAQLDMGREWEITEVADAVKKMRESAITLAGMLSKVSDAGLLEAKLDIDAASAAIAAVRESDDD